jgi:flagellar basal body-associated protein FliL
LEKIHINTEAQTKDKQTNNEVMIIIIIMIIVITVIAYYITSWTNTIKQRKITGNYWRKNTLMERSKQTNKDEM